MGLRERADRGRALRQAVPRFCERARLQMILVVVLGLVPAAGVYARIPASEFMARSFHGGLAENSEFMPPTDARHADLPFAGTLRLRETEITTVPAAFESRKVLGKDAKIFPDVAISFISVNGDLVPTTQDVMLRGSLGGSRSLWDVIVQPGRVWADMRDGQWSRASFPFALVNARSGETHNGVAMFLYRKGRVSNLRFQIVQQTTPYYAGHYFTATGLVPATLDATPIENSAGVARTYKLSLMDRIRFASWEELARSVGADRLAGFDDSVAADAVVLAGLDYAGTFYLKFCRGAGGPIPWCDRARFGVWSATKALVNELALLRLAQKYGPEVFDSKIRDYVPSIAHSPGWRDVRFDDAANMSTGVGDGSAKVDPNDIFDGVATSYSSWHEARSSDDKLAAILSAEHIYSWGPGKIARYRDQDMFVLGVAMNRFLKTKEGETADLWDMLKREVLEPIGIHYAPTSRTLEPDGRPGQPLMAFGYYPSVEDIVKITRLYHQMGIWNGRQLLFGPRISTILNGPTSRGLPTGQAGKFGETNYFNAFWLPRYHSPGGCKISYPRMQGIGGVVVALLPGQMTGIRIGKFRTESSKGIHAYDTDGMADVAGRLGGYCGS